MQHQPGIAEARRGVRDGVTHAWDSHFALQPAGGLMWFGKQVMEKASDLKLVQGTEGNRSKSFFILTSQQVLYKNIKAM